MFLHNLKIKLNESKSKRRLLLFLVMFSFLFLQLEFILLTSVRFNLSNILFTLSITIFICTLIFSFKKRMGIIIYICSYLLFHLFLLIHLIYFNILDNYFGINEVFYSGDGATQINVILQAFDLKLILLLIFNMITFLIIIYLIKKWDIENYNKRLMIIMLIISLGLRCGAIISLGEFSQVNNWIDYTTPRSTYQKWNNRTECANSSGLFEYTVRDIYVAIREKISFNNLKTIKSIDDYFEENEKEKELNKYTGIFEDKNVIIIQLETIDSWLITKQNMPILTKLMNSGINFSNRYAPSWGGGQTFNTEYALNTGLYIPVNNYNIYDSSTNYYPYSLANLFKSKGYVTNSIHFNQGYFYNREKMHQTFGYDNHYHLMDMGYNYHDVIDDEYLIDNDEIFNMIVSDEKFMSYIITYAAHVPYQDNYLCDTHYYSDLEVKNDPELTCVKTLSRISDNFIKKLTTRLEEQNKLEDTVLVFVTDHYAYGYNDEYVATVKGGSSKEFLERVPFIIWSSEIEASKVNNYLDTADILPTLANMFGLDYNPSVLLGTDVFSSYHENYVYFNDYSWVGTVLEDPKTIADKIEINDNIIKSNYYAH